METAIFNCDISRYERQFVNWYKQVPAGIPQFVLMSHHVLESQYGSGFSSDRFTSKATSETDYQFIIDNVEEADSAVYYCHTWDDSANEHVFGQGTKLIVTASTLPPPVLTLFPPSSDDLKTSKATLVCLANQMAAFYGDVSWTANGSPVTSGILTGTASKQADGRFSMSSYLTIEPSDWDKDHVYSCQVSVGSKSSQKAIKKSECS
ncbi:immunoglobulin lambda-1 light chain-like isoform X2 [Hypomesus transpacificus]|uniref:immunoglobulin lambda-1 light chain-like isoform X2 n=1 Tax=Hypomesus transpacificus TaxID=137520 RepID=UPI001F07688C|nr:immunoglobulin lambda-1 light chain-like isoform X2 [Hypomesus transpacificus]XP_046895084.1 immunoglobulin lambda-1 light chain-like isoform X2 [Hypomesus transpacificus]XP_046895085.1 immunoglobulin lambda-1 light chain-like isoform X2 [Hypomesus transpacificus]